MRFIIGVGNPGKLYEETRHNVGFAVVDALKKNPIAPVGTWSKDRELGALVARFGENATLAKPLTFVNNTGGTVSAIIERHKIDKKDILIVCDDANLDFGKLRLRESGSAGGHHGLQSIIEDTGFEEFARLRFGVRNARMPKDLVSFVLEKFDPEEQKEIGKLIERAALVCEDWANKGIDAAMNRLSRLQSIK